MKNQNKGELPQNNNGCSGWVIVLVIILTIGYCTRDKKEDSGNSSKTNNTESQIQENYLLAYIYAEDFIKERLKAPSTAKFPDDFERYKHVKYIGDNKYQIISWVDSQNSFGAMLRTKFSCTIKIEGENVSGEDIVLYE
ncbi:MAG: hypothetical protein LBF27_00510 [Sphingobacterium sp.]|jgi:hypothetical protein|nr:hypothetical protein [Sphingobacterium sp.]